MESFRSTLQHHVPERAVDYCSELWQKYPFEFKLRKRRVSKLGDYRFDPQDGSHTITVNADLNPFQFLVTYVHEVAHRVVNQHGLRQKPHGQIWKSKFQSLILPLLNNDIFPDDVLRVLAKHMKNPKASVGADPILAKALAKYDLLKDVKTLEEIAIGQQFEFRKRTFKKLEVKRTRAVCQDLKNGKRYLIPLVAEIEPPLPMATPPSKGGD